MPQAQPEDPGIPANPILSALKAATAPAHASLEAALDLLAKPLEFGRFRKILSAFYGFHAVWEPAIARSAVSEIAASRYRLGNLREDLMALGLTPSQLAKAPRCEQALDLVTSRAACIGSLYVLEGSTLGGQVINQALRRTAWAPRQGSSYFNPYGPRTAARWQEFKAWAEDIGAQEDILEIQAGAISTFSTLEAWLPGAPCAPARG